MITPLHHSSSTLRSKMFHAILIRTNGLTSLSSCITFHRGIPLTVFILLTATPLAVSADSNQNPALQSLPEQEKPIRQAAKELKTGVTQTSKKIIQSRKKIKEIRRSQPNIDAKIRILGIKGIKESEALSMIGNIAPFVVRNEPTPSRADDVAFLLEQALRKNGYPEAQVEWKIDNPTKTIFLTVQQGPTRNLGEIHISGIDDELKEEISAYFKNKKKSAIFDSHQTVPYIPSDMEKAEENATSYLHANGYWKAKVAITRTKIHPDTGLVDLYIHVSSVTQYHLSPIKIVDTKKVSLEKLHKKLKKLTGQVANTANILKAQSIATRYFTSQGYALASVDMTRELVGNKSQLTLIPKLGDKYRIGKIEFSGLEHTDKKLMHKRFHHISGRPYNPSKMALTQKRLISSGAFKSVQLSTTPNLDGTIDIMLKMKEGDARGISTYFGAGSFEGIILGLGYHDNNFRGKLQSLAVSVEYSNLGILGRASITDSMFRGSDKTLTLSTNLLSHEFDGYSIYEAGLKAELISPINDYYSMRFYAEGTVASSQSSSLPDSVLGFEDYAVFKVGFIQTLDLRNDKLKADKGFHGELTLETGIVQDISGGKSEIPYSRAILQTSYRKRIDKKQFVLISGQGGAIFSNDSNDFPIDMRFFAGGTNSVRSFPRREMGPRPYGHNQGGDAYWVSSVEYNRQVTGVVWSNLFFDAGSISTETSELMQSDVELAVGLGFWLNLPIGPIRAEYGYNLTRDSGEPAGTFHFIIGMSF